MIKHKQYSLRKRDLKGQLLPLKRRKTKRQLERRQEQREGRA